MAFIRSIKRNHGTRVPTSHLFFDSETVGQDTMLEGQWFDLTFRLAHAQYLRLEADQVTRETRKTFLDPQELWDFVERFQNPRRTLWIWGHNIGVDLTWCRFWEQLEASRYTWKSVKGKRGDPRFQGKRPFRGFAALGGRPCFISALGLYGRVMFVDLANYLPSSLEEIGESLGMKKIALPKDADPDDMWIERCVRDVDILRAAALTLMRQWAKEDCGTWEPTSAQLAMTSFRHIALVDREDRNPIRVVPVRDVEADLFEREFYHGGRVECYFQGQIADTEFGCFGGFKKGRAVTDPHVMSPLYLLDVQSHYPAVMRSNQFPFYRAAYWKQPTLDKFDRYAWANRCSARVFLDTPNQVYPVRVGGVLCFARGRFWTSLAGPELQKAIVCGHVVETAECAVYDTDELFTEWVDRWWEMKCAAIAEDDNNRLMFANMILRSLSGKWAQGGEYWGDCPVYRTPDTWGHWTRFDRDTGETEEFRSIAGHVQQKAYQEPPWWGFPAISAYITSYGRMELERLIALCPVRSVLHVATDALLVTCAGFDALEAAGEIAEGKLGKLKLKRTYYEGEIYGPNDMRLDDRVIRSGSWGKVDEIKDGTWWYSQWEQLPRILSKRPNGKVRIEKVKLENSKPIKRLSYGSDGWGMPFVLNQDPLDHRPLTDRQARWPLPLPDRQ